jgi:hypothetical protein
MTGISRREALASGIVAGLAALSAPASAGHNADGGPVGDFAIRLGDLDGSGEPVDSPEGRKRMLYISPEEINGGNDDRLFYTLWHDTNWYELEFFGTGGDSGSSKWADIDGDNLLEPSDDEVGIEVTTTETDELAGAVAGGATVTDLTGSALEIADGVLGVASGGIGATELADGAVGTAQLADSSVTAAKIPTDAAGPAEVDLAAIAGEFLEKNTSTASLDVAASPEWVDESDDSDGFLETRRSAIDGVGIQRHQVRERSEFPTAGGEQFRRTTENGRLIISSTATGQTVSSVSERGPTLNIGAERISDTVVRDRGEIIPVDTTGGEVTITLGTELEVEGLAVSIKDTGGNAGLQSITVDTESGALIDGSRTQLISENYGSLLVVFYSTTVGAQWYTQQAAGI